jgi:hypothetical protein
VSNEATAVLLLSRAVMNRLNSSGNTEGIDAVMRSDHVEMVLFLVTPPGDVDDSRLKFRCSNGVERINGVVVFHVVVVDGVVNTGV